MKEAAEGKEGKDTRGEAGERQGRGRGEGERQGRCECVILILEVGHCKTFERD